MVQRSVVSGEEEAEAEGRSQAELLILRLNREELGFRPISVVGNLADVTPEAVSEAPSTSQSGPFNEFKTSAGVEQRWVVSPLSYNSFQLESCETRNSPTLLNLRPGRRNWSTVMYLSSRKCKQH